MVNQFLLTTRIKYLFQTVTSPQPSTYLGVIKYVSALDTTYDRYEINHPSTIFQNQTRLSDQKSEEISQKPTIAPQ